MKVLMRNVGLMRTYKTGLYSSIKKRSKIQIALEYMIVFSFVLIIFAFLFALIATQRAEVISQQLFSQEQLLAQDIATQINNAVSGGNGYSAAIPISTEIGTTPIQVFITSTGTVLVNASIGKQIIQAVAYTQAKSISTNPLFAKGANIYQLPIANGTIALQNSLGTICIDYQCPTTSNLASKISLSNEVVHAAQFNGQSGSSYIVTPTLTGLNGATGASFSAWFYLKSLNLNEILLSDDWNSPEVIQIYIHTNGQLEADYGNGGWFSVALTPANTITIGKWYYVTTTYKSGGGQAIYINGVAQPLTYSVGSATSTGTLASGSTGDIAYNQGNGGAFNGSIANVQIYNTALSASQIQQLYQEGISGLPISNAGLVGWWPLNGNANDYSGNGNNGAIHGPLLFPTVAELFAKVTNQVGQAVSKDIVGFATSLGTFEATGQEYTNYTNSNGIAIAFLNQNQTTGTALVKATAYNGNTSLIGNLVAWWPLNFGQGTNAFDLSGNNNNGKFYNGAYWSMPNYVAQFNGQNGYIETNTLSTSNSMLTVTAWVDPLSSNGDRGIVGQGDLGSDYWELKTYNGNYDFVVYGVLDNTFGPVQLNRWSFLTATYNNGVVTLYINGIQVASYSESATLAQNKNIYIGYTPGDAAPLYFNGSIANVQVYNTSLSASQIQQLYQEGIAAPPVQTSNLVAWYPLDGNANEYQHGYNGSLTGPVSFVSTSNIKQININASSLLTAQFNGAGANVTIKSSHPLLTGNQATMAVWVYWTSGHPGGRQEILGADSAPANEVNPIIAFNDSGTDEAETWVCTTSSCWAEAKGQANSITPGRWYFLVSRYNGSSLGLWINGVQVASTGASGNLALQGNGNYTYIASRSNTGDYFNGKVANAQLYNTSLSASQIQQLYQEGIGGAPVQTSNLVGWWPLNGNANDYSGQGNNGTATNVIYVPQGAVRPATLSPIEGTGVNLNGANGCITANVLPLPTAAETQTAWVYLRSLPPSGSFEQLTWQEGGIGGLYIGGPTGTVQFGVFNPGFNSLSANALLTKNTWHFISGTYSGSQMTVCLDGANCNSLATSGSIASSSSFFDIGCKDNNQLFLNGSISNVQLYNTGLTKTQIQNLYNSQIAPSASITIPLSWLP